MKKLVLLGFVSIVSGCGGGGGSGVSEAQLTISRVEVQSNINSPTKVLSYDVDQSGNQYSGYMITNKASELTEGVYDALTSNDIEITHTQQRTSTSFLGNVIVDGKEYYAYVAQIGDNELLMAAPVEIKDIGWKYGPDVAFPDNAALRTIGLKASPVNLIGSATYNGKLMVLGGGGRYWKDANLEVNFDSSAGTFEVPWSMSGPSVYAEVNLNKSDGSFVSDNVIVSFNRDIFNPQLLNGSLLGNFTGSSQDGAIGVISSDAGHAQFKGAFALSK